MATSKDSGPKIDLLTEEKLWFMVRQYSSRASFKEAREIHSRSLRIRRIYDYHSHNHRASGRVPADL